MREISDDFEDDPGNEFVLGLLDFVANAGGHHLAHDLAGDALELIDLRVEVVEHGFAVGSIQQKIKSKNLLTLFLL